MNAFRRFGITTTAGVAFLLVASGNVSAAEPSAAVKAVAPGLQNAAPAQDGTASPAPATPPPTIVVYSAPQSHHAWWGDSSYRSPGLSFALSLTPMPVDFGNLYAENVGWGIAYTSVQLSLGAVALGIGANHMCYLGDCDEWSTGERTAMIALVSGYVVTKIVAGIHASVAAERFNRAHVPMQPLVVPTSGGAVLGWRTAF